MVLAKTVTNRNQIRMNKLGTHDKWDRTKTKEKLKLIKGELGTLTKVEELLRMTKVEEL